MVLLFLDTNIRHDPSVAIKSEELGYDRSSKRPEKNEETSHPYNRIRVRLQTDPRIKNYSLALRLKVRESLELRDIRPNRLPFFGLFFLVSYSIARELFLKSCTNPLSLSTSFFLQSEGKATRLHIA